MGCGWTRDPSLQAAILEEVIGAPRNSLDKLEFQANHRHSFHDQLPPSRPSANHRSMVTGITNGQSVAMEFCHECAEWQVIEIIRFSGRNWNVAPGRWDGYSATSRETSRCSDPSRKVQRTRPSSPSGCPSSGALISTKCSENVLAPYLRQSNRLFATYEKPLHPSLCNDRVWLATAMVHGEGNVLQISALRSSSPI